MSRGGSGVQGRMQNNCCARACRDAGVSRRRRLHNDGRQHPTLTLSALGFARAHGRNRNALTPTPIAGRIVRPGRALRMGTRVPHLSAALCTQRGGWILCGHAAGVVLLVD